MKPTVGGALDGCYQLQTALRALASPAIADPYSPFRPKGSRDGAVATVSQMGVGGVCVALLGRPWRLWRYGQIKRHGRKPYSIRHRAFVAFVAFYSCLGLANKKKKDDTLHPPADNITARERPRITPLMPQTP